MSDDNKGLIDDRTFEEGAIEAVKQLFRMNVGVMDSERLHTKAVTYALLEVAEQLKLLNHHLRKEAKRR